MASIKPSSQHPLFTKGLETDPLKHALEGMEREGSLPLPLNSALNSHLDRLLNLFEHGQLDRSSLKIWLDEMDSFVQADHQWDPIEIDRLQKVDHFLMSPVFDRGRFLNILSPFMIEIDPQDYSTMQKNGEGIDFNNEGPSLPAGLIISAREEEIKNDYEKGLAVLDETLLRLKDKKWVSLSFMKDAQMSPEQLVVAKQNLYYETLALLLNPNKYEGALQAKVTLAKETKSFEAIWFLGTHANRWCRAEFKNVGISLPLKKYHEGAFKKIQEWMDHPSQVSFVVFSNSSNPISNAFFEVFLSLVDWDSVRQDAFDISGVDFKKQENLLSTLERFVNRADKIKNAWGGFKIDEVIESKLALIPFEAPLEGLVKGSKREEAFRYRLQVEAGFQSGKQWGFTALGRYKKFSASAEKLFTQRGWNRDYEGYLSQKGREFGEGGAKLIAAQLLAPRMESSECEMQESENGFTVKIKDYKIDVKVGSSHSAKGTKHNFTLVLPPYDPYNETKKRDGFFSSLPLVAGLPKPVREVLNHYSDVYFKEAEHLVGYGLMGVEEIEIDPQQRARRINRVIDPVVNNLNKDNYEEQIGVLHEILNSTGFREYGKLDSLNKLFLKEKIEALKNAVQSTLDQMADDIHSDAYKKTVQFMVDWVNITRSASAEVQQMPIKLFLAKFPPHVLTVENVSHVGVILAILKAVPGLFYGNYIDSLSLQFEQQYLEPVTVEGLAKATAVLNEMFRYCGNMYLSENFKTFAENKRAALVRKGSLSTIDTSDGVVRIFSKDGRNLFDDVFESLHAAVTNPLHEIMMTPDAREDFVKRTDSAKMPQAELLFQYYDKTLSLKLNPESGLVDDLHDAGKLLQDTDFASADSVAASATLFLKKGMTKTANLIDQTFGANEAWRKEMFDRKVAPPKVVGKIRGDISVMEITLKDGTKIGHMYLADMSTGKYKAEMLGCHGWDDQWSSKRVTKLRPKLAIETVGIYADNLSRRPAWAMGITKENGTREVINSFWSRRVDGVVVISDHFRKFEIVHRDEVVGTFEKRKKFQKDFEEGKIDNYAQAQLIIYNGGNSYHGRTIVSPINTYKNDKRIIGIDEQGRLAVIKLTEDVTFYEAYEILKQLGIKSAVNMDVVGNLDHVVDMDGKHRYDAEGGSMNYVSKFVISVE